MANYPHDVSKDAGSIEYDFNLNCPNGNSVEFESNVTWLTVSYNEGLKNGTTILSWPSTSEVDVRTGIVTVTLKKQTGGESPCHTITINQAGTGCGCGTGATWKFSEANPIPSEGLPVDTVIGNYTPTGPDCVDYTAVLISSYPETAPTFGMVCENGNIKLTSAIQPNESTTDVVLYNVSFRYGGNECTSGTFEQSKKPDIPCTCDSIDFFYSTLKRTFPLTFNGGKSGPVEVAIGNPHGCGELSAVCRSEMLDGGDLIISEPDSEGNIHYYANVLNYDGDYRTSDAKLYFKKTGEEWENTCYIVLRLEQYENYCSCEKFESNLLDVATGQISIDCDGGSRRLFRDVEYNEDCYYIKTTSDANWLRGSESFTPARGEMTINAVIEKSREENPRTGHVTVEIYTDARYVDGKYEDGIKCSESAFTIVQDAYDPCDCEDLDLNTVNMTIDPEGYWGNYIQLSFRDCFRYETEIIYNKGEGGWLTIREDGARIYWTASTNSTGEERSATLKVTFISTDGGDVRCEKLYVFTQDSLDCSCEEIKEKLHVGSASLIGYQSQTVTIANYVGACVDEVFITGGTDCPDWITNVRHSTRLSSEDKKTWIADIAENESTSGRSYYGFSAYTVLDGVSCVKEIVISQEGKVDYKCTCNTYDLQKSSDGYESTFESNVGKVYIGELNTLPPDCFKVYVIPHQTQFFNVDECGYDSDKKIYVTIKENSTGEDVPVTVDITSYLQNDNGTETFCKGETIGINIKKK